MSTYKTSSVFGSKGKSSFAVIFWKVEVSCESYHASVLVGCPAAEAVQCLNTRGRQKAAAEQCILLLQLCLFALGQTLVSHFSLPAEVVASRAMTSLWVAVSRSLNPALFKGIGLFQMVGCVIWMSQASIPVVWSSEMEHKHCREK